MSTKFNVNHATIKLAICQKIITTKISLDTRIKVQYNTMTY